MMAEDKGCRAATPDDWYYYSNLINPNRRQSLADDGMYVILNDFASICLDEGSIRSPSGRIEENPERLTLGKFHLSVAEKDVERAWNLIAPAVVTKRLKAKVMTPRGMASSKVPEDAREKRIVIYFDRSNVADVEIWQSLLDHIESEFRKNGIRPGGNIVADRKIPGSSYIYMRYGATVYDPETGRAANAWDDKDDARHVDARTRLMLENLRVTAPENTPPGNGGRGR